MVLKQNQTVDLPKEFSFPVVVKPTTSGSSVGVTILPERTGYETAISLAFRYSDAVLVEQYIPGRELTVGFLGGEPLPVVEVIVQRNFMITKPNIRTMRHVTNIRPN